MGVREISASRAWNSPPPGPVSHPPGAKFASLAAATGKLRSSGTSAATNISQLDRAELGGVSGGDDPCPGLPGGLLDHGQVGGAELAGLVWHEHVVLVQRHGPAQLVGALVLAEEFGDVVVLGQALVLQHPRGVGRGGQPDHPPPPPVMAEYQVLAKQCPACGETSVGLASAGVTGRVQ